MGVKGLMKPLNYHIESENISSRETSNDLEKGDATYITHQFLCLLPTNIFFDKRKTEQISDQDQE